MAQIKASPVGKRIALDRRELAGALADIGVLLPIAVALIVSNGLSASAVLLPAGLLYLTAGLVYGLPVPVQPLKAFGAIAIAKGLGADEIAAGALLMGAIFLALGASGLVDLAARAFPRAVVRGIQLTVGLLFLKIAWGMVTDPPTAFAQAAFAPAVALPAAVAVLFAAFALRRRPVTLWLVGAGAILMLATFEGSLALGPSPIAAPALSPEVLLTALVALVLPQAPLTFTNSCVATADAARSYFGERARGVRPGRLATTLGCANLLSGTIAGMPVCHGAGGMTAHNSFGARTGGAPLVMGAALIGLALAFGAGFAALAAAFPLPVLAGMLAAAGLLHIGLLRDLGEPRSWIVALSMGATGLVLNPAFAVALGLCLWWLPRLALRPRPRAAGMRST